MPTAVPLREARAVNKVKMDKETQCILLQIIESIVVQQRIICDLAHSDVLIIGAVRNPQSAKAFLAAVEAVSSVGDSVLASERKLQTLFAAIARN